jgi:hypothetical protein
MAHFCDKDKICVGETPFEIKIYNLRNPTSNDISSTADDMKMLF